MQQVRTKFAAEKIADNPPHRLVFKWSVPNLGSFNQENVYFCGYFIQFLNMDYFYKKILQPSSEALLIKPKFLFKNRY